MFRYAFPILFLTLPASLLADPCGMVPPVYVGEGQPITRIGEQQTYVFYKDGVETFVIRPGFSGKVDEFGMLIPFPAPPMIRKVPDHIFPHIAAAVDPPEVVVDLRYRKSLKGGRSVSGKDKQSLHLYNAKLDDDEVRVVRQEAVGMYEVAVLEAGSAAALKRWMDEHGYRYPDGMDKACEEYVDDGWCFVAVKTKVGQKQGADPKPGQRKLNVELPKGASFDGYVQAMGFRFPSKELVVPMRLSSFNDGELRNVVYLLTDGPRKIRSIPEEYVVRQVSGKQLFDNLTNALPLRVIGGTPDQIPEWQRRDLPTRRNPEPHNGAAKELFASDLLAIQSGQLLLPHEEREKELLRIGERLGLRGAQIDDVHQQALAEERKKTTQSAVADVKKLTLTVIDGDFPREVLARKNLRFGEYRMPSRRNSSQNYDPKSNGPRRKRDGAVYLGSLPAPKAKASPRLGNSAPVWAVAVLAILLGMAVCSLRRK